MEDNLPYESMVKTKFFIEFPKDCDAKWQWVDVDRNSLENEIIRIEFKCVSGEDAQICARTSHSIHWDKPLDLKLKLLDPVGYVVNEWHLVNSKVKDAFFDFGNVNWDPANETPIEAVGYMTIKPEKVIILK
jgi:hypothetical protein